MKKRQFVSPDCSNAIIFLKTYWQKFSGKVRKKFYDTAKNSGRSTPPSSHINVDVEIKYIIISLYYGEDKNILLFKRSPY